MDRLPQDLLVRISDHLSTPERARLAILSREWHDLIANSWTCIRLEPAKDFRVRSIADDASYQNRQEQLAWLGRLTNKCLHTLQSLYIHPFKTSSLLPDLHLHSFSRLQRLELEPLHIGSVGDFRSAWDHASIAPEDMQGLSSLTGLEVLRLIVNGAHCRHGEVRTGPQRRESASKNLSLDTFAVLPKLRDLQISMDNVTDWRLTMSAHLRSSGFPKLKQVSFEYPGSWDLQSMAEVVSQLEALNVVMTEPTAQVMDAPNLTYLLYQTYRPRSPSILPFRTATKLRTLSCNSASIPWDLPDVSYNIASLCLEHHPEEVTPDVVRSWNALKNLTQLTVGGMKIDEVSILQPFTGLTGLKSLYVKDFEPRLKSHRIMGPEDNSICGLTKLVLKPILLIFGVICDADVMARKLPALQEFHGRFEGLQGEICSGTLQVLKIRYNSLLHKWPASTLIRDLPRLKALTLCAMMDFHREKDMLADILARLPRLRELCLSTRLKSHYPGLENNGDTIDAFLQALSAATELTALKVLIPNSDLTLSLISFPQLKSLAVACRAISFDCYTLPCKDTAYIDFHFMEASIGAPERFRVCQHAELNTAWGTGWKYFNIHREGQERPRDEHIFAEGENLALLCTSNEGFQMNEEEFREEFYYSLQGRSLLK